MLQGILGHLTRNRWPWSDKGHIANEHVAKLRQFIKRKFPKPFARARNARIVFDFESHAFLMLVFLKEILQPLFGVEAHRANFIHLEFLPKLSDTGLSKEYR